MSGKVKISSDMMRCYGGEGDVVAWLKKGRLVAKLMEIDDLASFIPLYLEGSALALYMEMSDAEQRDIDQIESRLKEAFAQGRFEAYGQLKVLTWRGEQVDVFANETRRLAGLAGWTGEGLELAVKLAFITGFPDHVSVELKRMMCAEEVNMGALIARARLLVTGTSAECPEVVAMAAGRKEAPGKQRETPRNSKGGIRCFKCGGPHFVKDCRAPIASCYRCGDETHWANKCDKVTCYRCQGVGHIARECKQGNGQGGAAVSGAPPKKA